MKISRSKKTKWLVGSILILLFFLCPTVFAAQKIKIGVIGPMKLVLGEHCFAGAKLAVEEINKAGGVLVKGEKYEIEYIKADSNEILSLPDAVSTMERLITVDKVDFVLGGYNTEPCVAMQEVVADHKKIWISTGTAAQQLTERIASNYERYKYTFRVGPPNNGFVARSHAHNLAMNIDKVKKELGFKRPRVAVINEKGVWAESCVDATLELNPKENYELVGRWVVSRTASDVTAEMNAIKSAKPHIIFDAASGPVGVAISKAWGELRIPATLTGGNIPGMSITHWQATNGMCNYETIVAIVSPCEITEKTAPFFKKLGIESPIYIAGTSYDGVYVLKEAIERAGSLEENVVIAELEKTDYRGVMGRIKLYPKGHKFPHDLMWGPGYVTMTHIQWRDGNVVTVWPDGHARLGDEGFKGLRYKGTVDYKLPPRMVEFWKAQKE